MLVNADVKSLELFVAADWYSDATLSSELFNKTDLHAQNQARWKLPSRVLAKVFVFKLIYGASAYGYANDPDFMHLHMSEKQWQKVIDAFYEKYPGIKKGHDRDIKLVKEQGFLEIPSGRFFNFRPKKTAFGYKWPLTIIKNYPIQGFGADLVKLARIEAWKRLKEEDIEALFIQTIHDSLVVDTPSKNVQAVAKILSESVAKVPELCYNIYSYKFSLPLYCEILVGPNKKDMEELVI